jgi:iron(III) transport system ATP-binding protein
MSVSIDIDKVIKKYGDTVVISGLSLQVHPGEFFTLLGPSGCGKTTLLRMIIGFNSIEGGTIKIADRRINDTPTDKRNMGMVFQNYAIFPHMSVKENVAFGLRMRKIPEKDIETRVDEILRVVKIKHLENRMPTELSGGQQQRVALARAIVIRPEVLLMDEPLSNLDAKLRVEMRNAIKSIQRQIDITTVYVTHDQEEALAVSDRIAVMNGGIIQQIGTPQMIYQRPANVFVSTFIGLSNLLDAVIFCEADRKGIVFEFGYRVEMQNLVPNVENAQKVCVSVRPEEFIMVEQSEEGIPIVIQNIVFLGLHTHYFVKTDHGQVLEVIQNQENTAILLDGTRLSLKVKTDKINVFHEKTKGTLIKGETK